MVSDPRMQNNKGTDLTAQQSTTFYGVLSLSLYDTLGFAPHMNVLY